MVKHRATPTKINDTNETYYILLTVPQACWEVMAAYHWVYDYVTCGQAA